ncbi:MAG: hypothetical protein ACI4TV_06900 [Paludibacteraceae bacterium]
MAIILGIQDSLPAKKEEVGTPRFFETQIRPLRLLLIAVLLFGQSLCLFANARQKGVAFDIGVGAGYSTLGYKAQSTDFLKARATGSWGVRANLGINYFFLDYLGVGLGLSLTRYGGALSLDGNMVWNDVTDTDGERYNHQLQIDNWREYQQQYYLAPNLMLQAAVPAGEAHVLIRFGVEYAFGVHSSYKANGTLTHTGYYPFGNLGIHDVGHGFYTTDQFRPEGELLIDGQQVALIGALGVGIPIAKNTELTIVAEATNVVWVSGTQTAGGGNAIGFHENTSVGEQTDPHYFIPEYVSLSTTSLIKGSMHPLYVGLQIGVCITIPFYKRTPCMCYEPVK